MFFSSNLRAYLQRGGVIAYPTESCFGLGCDPRNRAAVRKILRLKHRPWHKGLIVVAADLGQVQRFIQPLDKHQKITLGLHWPGPYTFLLPISAQAPKHVTGRHSTLAVRVSAHLDVTRLTRMLGPLVSTSANIAGLKPLTRAADVRRVFGGKVLVLPGRVGKRKQPSAIIDLQSGTQLRGK